MKENDGKAAARRTLIQRAIGLSVAVVALLSLGGLISPSNEGKRTWKRVEQRLQRHGTADWAAYPKMRMGTPDGETESGTSPYLLAILQGEMTLTTVNSRGLRVKSDGTYTGITGKFCKVNWISHKQSPSTTPMFRDVLAQSNTCTMEEIDLATIVNRVREYDTGLHTPSSNVHTLKLGGVAFHESRCGSTLVANLMQAANPHGHRVYSESPPPIEILREGDRYPPELLAPLLRDIVYLMSRSNDVKETHVFFKIQSLGTLYLPVFLEAFPDTPWIFVFREPVQVLMSHFKGGPRHTSRAKCAQHYARPPAIVQDRLRSHDAATRPSYEEFCAAHFATLTETALKHLQAPNSRGMAVEYSQLPDIMWTTILPKIWEIPITTDTLAFMKETAVQYSKGRGDRAGLTFEGDTEEKEDAAWEAVEHAAQSFLTDSYEKLQELSKVTSSK